MESTKTDKEEIKKNGEEACKCEVEQERSPQLVPSLTPKDLVSDSADEKDANEDNAEDQVLSPHDSLLSNELSISGSDGTPSEGNTPRDDTSSGSPSPIPDDAGDALDSLSRPKVRLGKDISLMMQALNSLQSPEEKIAALCKKYADLLEEHKLKQKQLRGLQRKLSQHNKDKDQLHVELNKAILAKSKMESLARELNKQNKLLKQEAYNKELIVAKEREQVAVKFQAATVEITGKIDSVANHNTLLQQENKRLDEKIATLMEQFSAREKMMQDQQNLETQILNIKLKKSEEQIQLLLEKQNVTTEENIKSNALCEAFAEREKELQSQIQYYSEKFEDFQSTLEKSNKIFAHFRSEMDRMSKRVKELESDTAMWKQRSEENDATLKCALIEKSKKEQLLGQLEAKLTRLTSLSRALQAERNELAKKVRTLEGSDKASKNTPQNISTVSSNEVSQSAECTSETVATNTVETDVTENNSTDDSTKKSDDGFVVINSETKPPVIVENETDDSGCTSSEPPHNQLQQDSSEGVLEDQPSLENGGAEHISTS